MISTIETEFIPQYGVWLDFANITCDFCYRSYQEDGMKGEYPADLMDAISQGWQSLHGLVCCPDCHAGFVQ